MSEEVQKAKGDEAAAMFLLGQMAHPQSDEDLRRENDRLKREKARLEGDNDQLEGNNNQLERELDDAKEEAAQERERADIAVEDWQDAERENLRLQKLLSEKADLEANIDSKSTGLDAQKLEAKQKELEDKQKELANMQAQLNTARKLNQEQGELIKRQKEECGSEKRVLQTQLETKKAALEDAQSKCEKEKREQKTELEQEKAALEAVQKKCEEEKGKLEAKLIQQEKAWKAENTKLKSELETIQLKQSGESKLEAKIEQLKKSAKEKEAELKTAKEQKTASDKKIAEEKTASDEVINDLKKELKTFEDIVIREGESKDEGESKTTAAAITEFLKNREEELNKSQAELRQIFTKVFSDTEKHNTEDILTFLVEQEESVEIQRKFLKEKNEKIETLKSEIETLQSEIDVLTVEKDTNGENFFKKKKEVEKLEKKIAEQEAKINENQVGEETTAKIKTLQRLLQEEEKKSANMQQKILAKNNEMTTLKARLKNLEEKSKLQNKSSSEETNNETDYKKKYEEVKEFYRSQISDWESKNDILKRQFENLQQSKASYPAYYKMLEERVKKIDTIELENIQLRIDNERKVEEVTRSYKTKIALAISAMDEKLREGGQPLEYRDIMLRQNNDELRRTIANMETERDKERNMFLASLQKKIGEMEALRENEFKHLSQLDILKKKLQSCLNTSKSETTGESKENYEKFRKKVSDLEATIQNLETEKSQTQEKFAAALLEKDKELENAENEIIDLKNQLSRQQVPSDGRSNLKQNREHDVKKGIAAVEFLIDTEFWNEINFSPSEDNLAQQIFQFLDSQDALKSFILDENKKSILLNNTTKEKFFQQLLLGVRNSLLLSEIFDEDTWKLSTIIVSVVLNLKKIVIDNFEIEYEESTDETEESTDETEESRKTYLSRLQKIRRYLMVGERRDTVKQLSQSAVFQKLFQINGKTVSVKVFLTQLRDAIKKQNQTSLSTYNGILQQLEDFQSEVRNTMRGNISTNGGKTRNGVNYMEAMDVDSDEDLLFPKLKF